MDEIMIVSFTFVGLGNADYNRDRLRQGFREIRLFAKHQRLTLSRGRRRRLWEGVSVTFDAKRIDG
jgi:hypothetical protein